MREKQILYIKNMVCPRCIEAVNELLISLNIGTKSVSLGEVILEKDLSDELKKTLDEKLKSKGFELLQDQKSKLIGQIKAIIIDKIHHHDEQLMANFSNYISEKLNHEYSYLSRLFSSVEGITIEKFIVRQKIERVKEFLFYNELTLSEIAFKMDYSSVAYLSSQFKKETGMTPSEFKQLKKPGHHSRDSF
ncbi:helix-turn-helix domain-containing protein [Flexithrix dorotheae]|uniref:helix-turn-helix domain-containing protein n=1 Tax=Flexithrix dorotheae TaxID=70993 RepID=UPI00036AC69A|nr:AraC family transcriptional regulator [Flexithrix dorotheae]